MNRVMSYLIHSLQKFGFNSLEEITAPQLKRAFKRNCTVFHPDKGGSSDSFDEMLSSYLYLCETMHRINGGRSSLQIVDAPEHLKQVRANQYMNELFDDLVVDSEDNSKPLPADFHERFAAEHVNLDANGYDVWLQADRRSQADRHDDIMSDDLYGSLTITPFVEETKFHESFEELVVKGKPPVTQSIILHPDDMAYSIGCIGSSLIKSAHFTSDAGLRPEYTDLQAAFTTENTVYDKLTVPVTERTLSDDSLAALVAERDQVYTFNTDDDAAMVAAYEKKRIDAETEHNKALQSYFKNGVFLKDSPITQVGAPVEVPVATVEVPVKVPLRNEIVNDFVKQF